ncbi:ABC transporter substrate-binding protein [Clostridium sp. Marseille-P2415]|uniref:ABC transporter substrate-binding protein n=1 Tax=Clostridium sp. Marseille-P2415 TaxID=1805471 RepID=UPI0009885187|nr:ABC transporter substrate-binding protein [Clostridium sp. Marseille-P2415]
MKKIFAFPLITLLLLGSVTGCGSRNSASTDSSSAPAASTSAETSTAGNVADASKEDKYGGSVTICYPDAPTTFFLPFSASTGDRASAAPAVESLGRLDAEGNTSSWLAETIKSDPEHLTCTVTLKKDIKFSDGTDLNAEALIWNFDKMTEGGKASELGNPVSYEATDDYTVVLTYDSWQNNWDTVLGEVFVYCPSAFEEHGEDWAAINPVGTGPFVISEYVKGSYVKYVKNENYWIEGQPYLDELTISYISDSTAQLSAFMNGEIDLLATNDSTVISQLDGKYTNIAQEAPDLGQIKYVMFCSGDKSSPFYDTNVRLAVMHAIDWEGYAYSLTGGRGSAVTQFGVPGAWSYDEDCDFVTFDTDLAKKMLSDAGYPNGFHTTITTIASNNSIAVLLQASLAEIGITADIKTVETADFNSQKAEGIYDGGLITGAGASKMDFTNNYIRLYSSKGVNYLNMMAHPKDYEDALFGALAATTLDEKKALLKEASVSLVNKNALLFPVAAVFPACYVQDGVADSGFYQIVSIQWTPEAIYLAK